MIESLELRHLRYFIAVAEELHFSRAAERLHIAQPPLSQQIRKLEQYIGHPLFTRNSRTVALTQAGEALLERSRYLIRRLDDDLDTVRRVGRGEIGTLTVGFIGSAMLTALPALIGSYRKRFVKGDLRLRELTTSSLVDAIRQGAVDLGFLRDAGPTEGLIVENVLTERFVVAVAKKHPLASRQKISLVELKGEPLILFARELGPLAWDKTIALCETSGFRPTIVQDAPEWLTVLRLVSSGLGFSIAPACVATIQTPGVICRELTKCPISTNIELARRSDHLNPIMEAFLAQARKMFGNDAKQNGIAAKERREKKPRMNANESLKCRN